MSFEPISHIKVGLCFDGATIPVGQLARDGRVIYFQYDTNFMQRGLDISPLHCPLSPTLQSFEASLFEGLPGVFNDSLPDGWGRLLLDRRVQALGVEPAALSPLDRLSYVGKRGMGALVYEPERADDVRLDNINIDTLAQQAAQVMAGDASDVLAELLVLNGSSAGARPKAMIGVRKNKKYIIHGAHADSNYESWLVKFPNAHDGADAGAIEYAYALMAAEAGLDMPEAHLFPAQKGAGYFAVKRFDRQGTKRLHMHTACGLLHSDFRMPSLDYEDLLALTMRLTKDMREVEKMFRLATFNVLAHNRDDHAKNFSFLMGADGEWKLSPAYDLTFSSGPNGEQSTAVLGEGGSPDAGHLVKLGLEAKIPQERIDSIIAQTKAALSEWVGLARQCGVSAGNVKRINSHFSLL